MFMNCQNKSYLDVVSARSPQLRHRPQGGPHAPDGRDEGVGDNSVLGQVPLGTCHLRNGHVVQLDAIDTTEKVDGEKVYYSCVIARSNSKDTSM